MPKWRSVSAHYQITWNALALQLWMVYDRWCRADSKILLFTQLLSFSIPSFSYYGVVEKSTASLCRIMQVCSVLRLQPYICTYHLMLIMCFFCMSQNLTFCYLWIKYVLDSTSTTRPKFQFKLVTSRSWQYISCYWDACSYHLVTDDCDIPIHCKYFPYALFLCIPFNKQLEYYAYVWCPC